MPVIGRAITLRLGDLPAGDYTVEVAVARPDQDPVRGRRIVRIGAR